MLELGFVVMARARTERAGERIVGVGEEARCLSIAEAEMLPREPTLLHKACTDLGCSLIK
jgi:hypothetical protein